ncbi:MAG: hypothetical protein V3S00_01005 [Dehalococcoidia bacterium]
MAKSVPLRQARPVAASLLGVAPYVLWPLLVAGLGELILYRMFSRVGVHIPKEGVILDAYDGLIRLGSFAFNVSSVMVFFALGLLAYAAIQRWSSRSALFAAAPVLIVAFGALSFLLAFVEEGNTLKFTYGALSLGIMMLLAAQAWTDDRNDTPRKVIVTLIVLAYLASQYYVLANQAYSALGLTTAPAMTTRALELAELLVVVNAFVVFWAWSGVRRGLQWRPSRMQLGVALLLMVMFLSAHRGADSSTAAILSLWTLGLTLYLPLPIYVLALGLYGATLVACLSEARRDPVRGSWDVIALGLLPVAGLTLEMTYVHLIALVALLLLVQPPERSPDPAISPAAG